MRFLCFGNGTNFLVKLLLPPLYTTTLIEMLIQMTIGVVGMKSGGSLSCLAWRCMFGNLLMGNFQLMLTCTIWILAQTTISLFAGWNLKLLNIYSRNAKKFCNARMICLLNLDWTQIWLFFLAQDPGFWRSKILGRRLL